ncbi:MAG TPA: hypothetical protein DF613_01170 [Lachnospiraceae bacterium]|nr:hypothetical protein [Lachnospiraceae bacterium]
MKLRKLMAGTLAMTMVVSSSMTVFASGGGTPARANEATGTGEAFNHVDKDVYSVTFPTTTEVANIFNYYVDPERAIQGAGTLADGNTAVTPNANGVYFAHPGTPATPAQDASVTAFTIADKTEADEDITVTVPGNTAVTGLTYSKGWKDPSGNAVAGVSVTDNNTTSATAVTLADGDEIVVGTVGVDSCTIASVPGKTAPDADLKIDGVDSLTNVTLTYYDRWVGNDTAKTVVTPTLPAGLTPVDGNTITVAPHQDATPEGAATYESDSVQVNFEGKNSVDADITVRAEVTASAGGKDIALVKDDAALTAATDPALLLTLSVGSKNAAITSSGASVTEQIVGKPNNFAVTTENNKFVYGIRTNTDETPLDTWSSAAVKLSGKTNNKTISDGMTAPSVKLTWSVAKHVDSPTLSATTVSATQNTVTVTNLAGATKVTGVSITPVGKAPVTLASPAKWSYNESTKVLTFVSAVLGGNPGASITVTFDDNSTATLSVAS